MLLLIGSYFLWCANFFFSSSIDFILLFISMYAWLFLSLPASVTFPISSLIFHLQIKSTQFHLYSAKIIITFPQLGFTICTVNDILKPSEEKLAMLRKKKLNREDRGNLRKSHRGGIPLPGRTDRHALDVAFYLVVAHIVFLCLFLLLLFFCCCFMFFMPQTRPPCVWLECWVFIL